VKLFKLRPMHGNSVLIYSLLSAEKSRPSDSVFTVFFIVR